MDESRQEKEAVKVPRRILGVLLSSVAAGVVPRIGAPYIAIGRTDETAALCRDLDMVRAGGAGMRFIVGPYGSGKSFLLFELFYDYLISQGTNKQNIIKIALDDDRNAKLRNADNLSEYLYSKITSETERFYVLLDEAQFAVSDE